MFFRHTLPLTSRYRVHPPITRGSLLHQYTHPHSTLDFFLGFHYIFKHYGEWIRPIQLSCHYSTVKCVVQLFYSAHIPAKPIWMDQSLFFSVISSQLNQHGWIIPLQHRLHIHSIHYLIQLYNDTLF